MAVYKRELAFSPDPAGLNGGDRWHLVLDADAGGLYVEHTWHHVSVHTPGESARGHQRFGINDFLTLAAERPARSALVAALTEMFRDAKQP